MTTIERRRFRDIYRFDSWGEARARSWRRGRSGALTVAGGSAVSVLAPSGSGVVAVAAGDPRRESSGLLISPSRSNLLAYSNAIAAQWTPTNVTPADSAAPGPDGGATSASTLTETSATGEHKSERVTTSTLTAATYYCVRARAKCLTGSRNLRLGVRGTSTQQIIVTPAGVVASNSGIAGGVRNLQNGWLEIWMRLEGQGTSYALVGLASGTTTSYAGDNASKWAVAGVSVELAQECAGPLVETSGSSLSTGAQTIDLTEPRVLARLARGRVDIDVDFEVGAELLGSLDTPLVSLFQDATHYLDLYAKQIQVGPGSTQLGTITGYLENLIYWGGTWWASGASYSGKVLRWNGTAWDQVAVCTPGAHYFGPFTVHEGDLVVGPATAGVNVYRTSDGTSWTSMGSPAGNYILELCSHAGSLYAGDFNYVWRWTGSAWVSLGYMGGTSRFRGLASVAGSLYCCGYAPAGYGDHAVFRLDGGTWTGLGKPLGVSYHWRARNVGGVLWVCGYGAVDQVVSWNGSTWDMRGAPGGSVTFDLAVDPSGDVWAIGSDNDRRLMRWNGSSWTFVNQPDAVATRWPAIAASSAGDIATFYTGSGGFSKFYVYSASDPTHALQARQPGGNTTLSTAGTLVAGNVLRARLRLRSDGSYRVRLLDLTAGTELGAGSGTLTYSALAMTKLRLGADHTGAAGRPIWLRGIEVR